MRGAINSATKGLDAGHSQTKDHAESVCKNGHNVFFHSGFINLHTLLDETYFI